MTTAIPVVSRDNPRFPPLLRETPDAPTSLFVLGEPLESAMFVAVVGTRRPTRYGVEVARWIAQGLAAAGVVVVSGMARGIDSAAHAGALDAGGATVAVLGCGLDRCYPRSNAGLFDRIRSHGALISEFPAGTPALPHHFPQRNRVIAGMSCATVIVEGRRNGGAMITARLALDYGRDVFAVPGLVHSPQSEGPHVLLRDGARIVTSPSDVLEDLGSLGPGPQDAVELDADERRVVAAMAAEPALLDVIARSARLPTSTTSAVLTKLELRGLVTRHAGGRFSVAVGAAVAT